MYIIYIYMYIIYIYIERVYTYTDHKYGYYGIYVGCNQQILSYYGIFHYPRRNPQNGTFKMSGDETHFLCI